MGPQSLIDELRARVVQLSNIIVHTKEMIDPHVISDDDYELAKENATNSTW